MFDIKVMKSNEMLELAMKVKAYKGTDQRIILNFNNLSFIEPAGAVIFSNILEYIFENKIKYEVLEIEKVTNALDYGISMGVFQDLNLDFNYVLDEGGTYISPKKIKRIDIFNDYDNSDEYAEFISEKLVDKSIHMFNKKFDENVISIYKYTLREIFRNIFDHSKCEYFKYALQIYQKNENVELVIYDDGVGLAETIPFDIEEKFNDKINDIDALKKAIIPGVTASSNHSYASEDYKNSGFGLAVVREILKQSEGTLIIGSGDTIGIYNSNDIYKESFIEGTIVIMRFSVEKLSGLNFEDILEIVKYKSNNSSRPSVASASLNLKLK